MMPGTMADEPQAATPHRHPPAHGQGHGHGHGHGHAHGHRHEPDDHASHGDPAARHPAHTNGAAHRHAHGHHGQGDHAHHGHAHLGHAHHHAPARFDRAFALGIALNTGFVAVEAFYGWHTGALALLADAAHNLGDVGGLLLAWGAAVAARRRPDARHTYGWQRATLLAALANALALVLAMGALGWEALQRLGQAAAPAGWTMVVVAAIGIVVNGGTALLFLRGSHDDLNLRGAFLHMAGDALVSLGVVLGGLLVLWQGWAWVDPVLGLTIAAIVVAGTWGLLRQSLHLLLDGVPAGIALPEVRGALAALPGVQAVHDLHVWALGSTRHALTAHLVLTEPAAPDTGALLREAHQLLAQRFGIQHATLQLEPASYAAACGQQAACDGPG